MLHYLHVSLLTFFSASLFSNVLSNALLFLMGPLDMPYLYSSVSSFYLDQLFLVFSSVSAIIQFHVFFPKYIDITKNEMHLLFICYAVLYVELFKN